MWQPNGRGAGGWAAVLLLLAGAAGLEGCSTLGYYAQSVAGQLGLMARRRPITEVVRSPETSPALRAKLETVEAARAFASRELLLPDNGSYRSYADIDRPYVVWSVVATPEFSLAPRTWCFPVAGCVAYRGYFCEEAAHAFAAKQRAGGDDVFVGGVAAYSTLGWFDDPVPSSVAGWPAEDLAGLIFHELAHQAIYVPDDSGFNEAFAVTVQREGMRRWLAGREAALKRYRRAQRYEDRFLDLIFATRERLQAVYGSSLPDPDKRAAKARIFADLRKRYGELKAQWGGDSRFDAWFKHDLNNARLASVATYHELEPGFLALLRRDKGDLAAFYSDVRALAALDPAKRRERLVSLAGAGSKIVGPSVSGQ